MCVIITHGPKTAIDRDEWESAWRFNDDGGGVAYLNGRRITVARSLNRDALWKDYRTAIKTVPTAVVVHMRIATHGNATLENCHPFAVRRGEVIAHNGILLPLLGSLKPNESDTRAFVRIVLKHLPPDWPDNPGMAELVEEYLRGDRLAVLSVHTAEPVTLFGAWEKDKSGARFSNTYHRRATDLPYGGRFDWAEYWDRRTVPLTDPRTTMPVDCMAGLCLHVEHRLMALDEEAEGAACADGWTPERIRLLEVEAEYDHDIGGES